MIELIKTVVDVASKALPEFADRKKKGQIADLGSELFLFYVEVNQALVTAENIVNSLEVYVQRMSRHLETGDDEYALTAGTWVVNNVNEQVRNLRKISRTLARWRTQLQVLDGAATNKLSLLLASKFNALEALETVVKSQRLPLDVGEHPYAISDHGVLDNRVNLQDSQRERYVALLQRLNRGSVDFGAPWGENTYDLIRQYLEVRQPRHQLQEIRDALESIRKVLEANFSLTDVLLRVGDKRA